ncbi:ComEC/Rec2 family competence protein [Agromyces sp. MMS24-K17]|uniref:ComEC/Rec2 family competence protein n=1 Tax=Agromyces sp. MMS24-K17 TaxID=3372850 RepID=UPI003754D8D2
MDTRTAAPAARQAQPASRRADLRLLLPAVAAWAAAWWLVAMSVAGPAGLAGPGSPDGGTIIGWWPPVVACWAACAACVAVLLLAVRRRARNPRSERAAADLPGWTRVARAVVAVALPALAAAALVAHSTALGLDARAGSPLAAAAGHRTVDVVVELDRAPRAQSSTLPWAVDGAAGLRIDGHVVAVGDASVDGIPVTASIPADVGGAPAFGSRAAFRATVSPLEPGERAAFRLRPVGDVEVGAPPPWLAWAAGLRAGFAAAAAGLPGDGGALVPGLAIGDTSAVGADLDAAMKASSLSHLTAVSGANCALVTAAAFGLAALLGLRRRWRILFALVALAGFTVLVTPESSVIRAGAMALVVLVARATGRPGGGVAALALAVVALLVADPWLARDYGFALSACATAGLILLAGPLSRALTRVMPGPVAAVLGVPLAAQLACQPVLILLDPAIAAYGVPANLLAAPAAPVGTVVGLVGCLVLPLLPQVGLALLQVAWLPASWIALVAHGAAGLPAARLPWPEESTGAGLLVVVTALALWLLLARRRPRPVVVAITAVLLVAAANPVGAGVAAPWLRAGGIPPDWILADCDVGQGDAVLLRSDGATALVDTGPDPAALARCLDLLGVRRIDLLVLTHWDQDHVGGVDAVVGRVDTVLHGPPDGNRSARPLGRLAAAGATAVLVERGVVGRLGAARWRVLWPIDGEPPGNDASVVLELDAPEYRGLFLGDLGEDAQDRMLARSDPGRVDLVKVAHHGSADQSTRLYERVRATVGVIGVGVDNGYGHPTASLLEVLAGIGTAVVRSDRCGTAVLSGGADGFDLWSERACDVGGSP